MKKLLITTGILTLILSIFVYTVHAALPGEGLTISPPIVEQEIKSGETKTNIIRISNPTDSLVEAYPTVMDFRAKGETGEPAFYESEESAGSYALSNWITFKEPKIAMAPEQVKEFSYTITVPTNAEPGGHYGAVFFATEPPESELQGSQVSLSTMIGSLVLIKVPGQIVEKAVVDEFKTNRKIYFKTPTILNTKIANLGNVHFKPRGDIEIKGWFGTPKDKITFNESAGNVLPDSVRKFENKWQFSAFAFGYFKAEENIIYGDAGKTLTENVSFWILPWWILVVLIGIILLVVFMIFFKKSKKNMVITEKNVSGTNISDSKL